ncbi:hypothetical protein MOQ72_34550 [Saccharopolyspora sp. K220]|uniref:hypothetical protein n=1 Tax=Saccharopolyspora soli TaxID=2926618 RepID=UPI001F591B21|nr:hypothetical protein [Saccharopolyspora soli]MCI2422561.1 hypothetical protein [Saccharopolyspora soli]
MATSRFTTPDVRLAAADLQRKLADLLPLPLPGTVPHRRRANGLRELAARRGDLVGSASDLVALSPYREREC